MTRFLQKYRNELGLVAATILVIAVAWTASSTYWTAEGRTLIAKDLLRDTSLLGIFALGAATVIIAGGIDLSSGSMIAFSGTLFFGLMITIGEDVEVTHTISAEGQEIKVDANTREFDLAGRSVVGVIVDESSDGAIEMRVSRRVAGRQQDSTIEAKDRANLQRNVAAIHAVVVADPHAVALRKKWETLDDPAVRLTQKTNDRSREVRVEADGKRYTIADDGQGGRIVVTMGTGKAEKFAARTLAELRQLSPEAAEVFETYVPTADLPGMLVFWRRIGVPLVALLGVLLVAILIGSFHAWLITVLELPPFVATLASLVGLRSLARLLIQDVSFLEYGQKKSTITLGSGVLPSVAADGWWIPCVVFVVLAALFWLLLGRTVVGRHLYAMGGNETAARLSGIRTGRLNWLVYCLGTTTAAIAGMLYACKIGTASPSTDGMGYELNAIAAAVVGGCSLAGGVGSVAGVMLGALFLRVVIDSVAKLFKSQPTLLEGLVVGTLVVLTVAFNELRSTPGTKKQFFPGSLGLLTVGILTLLAGVITYVTSTEEKSRNALFAAGVTLVVAGARAALERRGGQAA